MRRTLFVYATVIGLCVLTIVAILRLGETRFPQSVPGAIAQAAELPAAATAPLLAHVRAPLPILIIQLLLIVTVARLFGRAASLVRQPPVVGEIAAGLALGPSLLGHVWPAAAAFVFPDSSLPALRLLSQIGVILYMFIIGLELVPEHLRNRARSAIAVSHFSIVTPFLFGVLAALALFGSYAPPGVSFQSFALFMGIAMSITAFPVLARVLEERGLSKTPLGSTAITCAAVDDITAWTMLAFVVTLVTAGGAGRMLVWMLALGGAFILLMVYVIKPLVARMFTGGPEPVTNERTTAVLGIMFASALFTEVLGIHALFGAFLTGTIMPGSAALRHQLRARLESFSAAFLLPLFFTSTGLRTNIGLLNDAASWVVCVGIILIAIAGKLLGTMLAARWTGSTWHDAFVLGALMNTRGLMELIALNVGYELGILSPTMFTMLVLMALVTTTITGPLIDAAAFVKGRRSGWPVPRPAES